jgi:excisionase family DNA binding protein
MSSNLRLKRVCEHCKRVFTAKTTVTKFCSDECAKKNYKLRQKTAAISESNEQTKQKITSAPSSSGNGTITVDQMEIVDITTLCAITTIGERTMYRLIKDQDFPKLKIGGSLRFHKETVIQYLVNKYRN